MLGLRPRLRLPLTQRFARQHSTQTPPPAGPFKPGPPPPSKPHKPNPAPQKHEPLPDPFAKEPLDPARGAAASLRFLQEGKIDPRYKPASRRVIAIICAVPIFLVTSWVLFQRQFLGVEQRQHVRRSQDADVAVLGEGEGIVQGGEE